MNADFSTYLSPFSWRYGSHEMRRIWSEEHKRGLWRLLWVALAETQAEFGLIRPDQVVDLQRNMQAIDIPRALEIEAEIHHDLMAELKTFAEQSPVGGGILHLGATSADIEDNADILRIRASLELLLEKLYILLMELTEKIETWADTPLIAFTHLQPAEPSTLGYRLAQYAQDLLIDWEELSRLRAQLRGKGFKGAVGTGASYAELLGTENLERFERRLSERLELPFFHVATQVYPRKQDYLLVSALAGLGGSLYKFAFDLRLLQSPPLGELGEPFGINQVGSSAMPFKRNPVQAEKIDSLGRLLAQMPRLAWDNAAHSLLERTLDDSANRRTLLPEAFLAADEMLVVAVRILKGLRVNQTAMQRNLAVYGPFAALERLLLRLSKAGADRQELHERLRMHAMSAWQSVQQGEPNPLAEHIARDAEITSYLSAEELCGLTNASRYLGYAPQRSREFARILRRITID
jgi:adenylosuccinate lyase